MYRRRFYIILMIVLLCTLLLCSLADNGVPGVEKGYTEPLIPNAWQNVIVNDINTLEPDLYVNGVLVEPSDARPYVTNTMDVMIPVDMIRSGMNAAAVRIDEAALYLCRGNHKVRIDMQTDAVTIGGETGIIAGAAIEKNGKLFVSSELIQTALGYKADFDAREKKIEFVQRDPSEPALPDAFSLAETGQLPAVQDQGKLGTCWAFSALSALESSLLPAENYVFSRDHMVLANSFGKTDQYSGDSGMAAAYLLAWQGPVSDPSDLYGDGVTDTEMQASLHVQGINFYEEPDVQTIKESVFNYGGVSATMYLVMADSEKLLYVDHYYSEFQKSYFYNGSRDVNHDVLIVGWDDHFDKNRFVLSDQVPGDGAFLCQNSWGSGFGSNGLFWVSYYDKAFAASAICFTDVEKVNNYDRIYQTDLCGATANAGYGDDTAWFANVYTADSEEMLSAAGFYTLGKDSVYEIYTVHDYESDASLRNGTLAAKGTIAEPGYHTVRFPTPEQLSSGERFAVIVKLTTPGISYPVAIEKVTDHAPGADISDGSGYLSNNGVYYKNTEEDSELNVCLKVYTRLRSEN